MKAGENIWKCLACGHEFKHEDPRECPKCKVKGHDEFYARVPESRVKGDKYTPYYGKSIWVHKANQILKEWANANFRRQ